MKVLLISTSVFPLPPSGYAGLENLVFTWACELSKLGCNVSVVAPEGSTFPEELAIELIPVPLRCGEDVMYGAYKDRLMAGQWDAVFDNTWLWFSVLAQMEADRQLPIIHCHHSDPYNLGSPPPIANPCIVAFSEAQANVIRSRWGIPVQVVHHGIDLDFYKPDPSVQRGNRYLFLARYTPEKGCIPSGHPVICNPAVKQIEDVKVGDKVLSHDGLFHKVTETYKRHYKGELIHIRLWPTFPELELTPEHPILVFRYDNSSLRDQWIAAADLKVGDRLAIPIPKSQAGHRVLKLEDFIAVKKIGSQVRHCNSQPIPSRIKVDRDFMRFCGYYIAEGSTDVKNWNGLNLHFHAAETHYVSDVSQIGERLFGIPAITTTEGNRAKVQFRSCLMGRLFASWFGRVASERAISQWAFNLPKPLIQELIKGIWRGDGYSGVDYGQTTHRYGTVSKTLAYQLVLLLAKFGIVAELRPYRPNNTRYQTQYHLLVQQPYSMKMSQLLGIEHVERKEDYRFAQNSHQQRGHFRRRWGRIIRLYRKPHLNRYILCRVKEIHKAPFEGDVFNLEVEDSHSYCTHVMAVHNCLEIVHTAKKCRVPLDAFGDLEIIANEEYARKCFEENDGRQIKVAPGIPRIETVKQYQSHKALVTWPNYVEIFGLTTIECMATGTPVISKDSGAAQELIKHGKSGFVVSTLDELEDLIKSDAVSQIKPEDCRKQAEKFSIQKSAEGHLRRLQDVAEGHYW